jgi:protein-S-isoprenylcysteine O-methyltransferase Ste14
MSIWFLISFLGLLLIIPIYFLSVEHNKLEERFGREKGYKVGAALGMASGWGFFIFLIGLWISPQERFSLQVTDISLFGVPLLHLLFAGLFLLPGAWFGIKGVTEVGMKTAETHRAERVVTTGAYSRVRHPQYLGSILAHVGATFLLSAYYSLLVTPIVILVHYIFCWKEEQELIKEFGDEYKKYRDSIPMLIPGFRK